MTDSEERQEVMQLYVFIRRACHPHERNGFESEKRNL